MNSMTLPSMTAVTSSHIAAVGHDAARNDLHVRFKDSGHYVYENVPAELHRHLLQAESVGGFFARFVKGKFSDRKLMNVQIAPDHNSNPRAVIGNNQPPEEIEEAPAAAELPALVSIEGARDCYKVVAAFLAETPVIERDGDAKKAANFFEQTRRTLGCMDDERKLLVNPLNDQVEEINDRYRQPRECIKGLKEEIARRLKVYTDAEEAKRAEEAEKARKLAEVAERRARQAEEIEREAKADADVGVVGINVAAAIANADQAFDSFKRAERTASRTEKQIPVRLNGGFGRAVSMRKSETLILDDAAAAIAAMGVTDAIRDAILSSARAYRKLNGSLPTGVTVETDRKF